MPLPLKCWYGPIRSKGASAAKAQMRDVDVTSLFWDAVEPMALAGTLVENAPSKSAGRYSSRGSMEKSTFAFAGRSIHDRREIHLALDRSMVEIAVHLSNVVITERLTKGQQLETSISALGILDGKAIGKLHPRGSVDANPYPHRTVTVKISSLDDDPSVHTRNVQFGCLSTGAYIYISARLEVLSHISYSVLKRCHCCIRLKVPVFTDNTGLHWKDVGAQENFQEAVDFEYRPWLNPIEISNSQDLEWIGRA